MSDCQHETNDGLQGHARPFQRFFSGVVMVAALSTLVGCAASGTRYYTLQTVPVVQVPAVQSLPDALNVQAVSLPAQVDRPQLVLAGKNGAAVSVMNDALWLAPLDDEIRLAVATRMSQKLGVPDLNGSVVPDGVTLWSVRLTIHRFDAIYGQNVVVQASWRLARQPVGQDKTLPVICSATVDVPAAASIESTVQAYQQAMQLLGDRIAAQIKAARAGHNPRLVPQDDADSRQLRLQGCTTP